MRGYDWFRMGGLAAVAAMGLAVSAVAAQAAGIADFVGSYEGSAEMTLASGATGTRDMSVEIAAARRGGFRVEWSTVSYREDGSSKEKSYAIDFVPTDRSEVFAAAMQRDVFGHDVQLDPMKGEPYVWARIEGETLSVYSLFVSETGGYEIQQFDRTLAEGGLQLDYKTVRDGQINRTISTFLTRQ
ncbi:MAG: hypothetical protein NXH82_09965 [Rhodobacteraceae bacterium]|nr:hypothetical protein [Paracoccaceae bacterium]